MNISYPFRFKREREPARPLLTIAEAADLTAAALGAVRAGNGDRLAVFGDGDAITELADLARDRLIDPARGNWDFFADHPSDYARSSAIEAFLPARITLSRDGEDVRAKVEVAAAEMGMGTATTTALVTAERLGLAIEQVEVVYGDSAIPGAIMAGGSQQTAAIGAAVIAAHAELVGELLKLAGNDSPLAGLSAQDVGCDDGGLAALADPARRERYVSILARAQRDAVTVTKAGSMPLEMMHWSMHSHSALFCEVAVNTVTGETRVRRFLGSFDCGRILNPKTAASQFRGGIIMGLGMALMEGPVGPKLRFWPSRRTFWERGIRY